MNFIFKLDHRMITIHTEDFNVKLRIPVRISHRPQKGYTIRRVFFLISDSEAKPVSNRQVKNKELRIISAAVNDL